MAHLAPLCLLFSHMNLVAVPVLKGPELSSTRTSNAATDDDLEDRDFFCDRHSLRTLRPRSSAHFAATPVLFAASSILFFTSRVLARHDSQEHAEKSRALRSRSVRCSLIEKLRGRSRDDVRGSTLSRAEEDVPGCC
ncbi:hypothetical protein BU25DRAFT_140422 [Macroventuria anomochaeta]|uniref:Uncharacterized protein n=1 Tax=Macroventuria anomochaeta TaxID=301207 RepID=A0ACB6SCT9_9PLEO|nr:uncharacterized protein BU25DRAFT_140422 [Macroventuria anomochaeta]KAF2632115.1 hypothetical protein BU25DRAFT_140422 [Macroventuria anomochaeta]